MCGANGPGVKLEVDHIISVAEGGSDALNNLQTLCFECNRGKRNSI
ncbi:MAG: HNH endonuclease [Gammaproteobacteria bacterium]|nr:HNH endonuclease [Gammaproteobacteria bacterium]